MSSRDLVALLRAQDEQFRLTPIGLAAETRIRARLRDAAASSRRPRWWAGLVVACLAAGVTMGLAWGKLRSTTIAVPDAKDTALDPEAVRCNVRQEHERVDASGPCTLELGSATVRAEGDSEIQISEDSVRVLRGRARFEVAPVPAGSPPFRVRVGGGVIEVVGTKFVISENNREGSVELLEGKIRFVRSGVPPVEIRPGERFRWDDTAPVPPAEPSNIPFEKASAPPPARTLPAVSAAPRPGAERTDLRGASEPRTDRPATRADGDRAIPQASVDAAVERAIRLRGEGRFREAESALAEASSLEVDAHTAEILSFEEGDLLEHFEDDSVICSHWKEHLSRFPDGQYRSWILNKRRYRNCR